MTSNKEDYLKTIYDEGGYDTYVSNKVIAEKLGVAPPSVSEMLSKLQHDGLIEYRAYHGSKLTEKGLASCIGVVRSHELWEVFLIEHLGFTWWEAHEEAHRLEHVASKKLVDKLDEFLGHPQTCPHGSLIPDEDNPVPNRVSHLSKMSDMDIGEEAVIAKMTEDRKLLDYLERSGIKLGKVIKIVSKDEYEGPIAFEQEGVPITISHKAATQIFVKSK